MLGLDQKWRISGRLVARSALHVGSGGSGPGASDSGVVKDAAQRPVVPGSSVKGVFRSTAESLAGHLRLSTCFLESGAGCLTGDRNLQQQIRNRIRPETSAPEVERILAESTCDICRVFGSPLEAGRVHFMDCPVDENSWIGVTEVRDGVCLDRDARTARPGLKFDYEVVPAGTVFGFGVTAENLNPPEQALVAAVLLEWERGFHLGGRVSRGAGSVNLEGLTVEWADLKNPEGLRGYLIEGTMVPLSSEALRGLVEAQLGRLAGE